MDLYKVQKQSMDFFNATRQPYYETMVEKKDKKSTVLLLYKQHL